MAGPSEGDASLSSRLRTTPGAYPSTPGDTDAPSIVSTQLSLTQAVYQRRAEFTCSYTTKVKVGTWNVASLAGTDKDVGGWFIGGRGLSEGLNGLAINEGDESRGVAGERAGSDASVESSTSQEKRRSKKRETLPRNEVVHLPGGEDIGLYVLGLQEIVDVSSATEALRPFSDPHPARKWKRAVEKALPEGYRLVAEQQLIGLFLVIYASPSLAPQISSVSTTSVGTGLMGYMGNKGAVTARIVLGETTRIVFINCHLGAGAEKGSLERRNWDASQIVSRTRFDPVYDGSGVMEEFGEGIGDEDFAFWFGDLNYRLDSMPAEDVRRLLMLHTRNEYGKEQKTRKSIDSELESPGSPVAIKNGHFVDIDSEEEDPHAIAAAKSSSPSLLHGRHLEPATDPTSLQATLSSLLPHDQLHAQMRSGKAFHDGWREGPIDFLPTYKYDVGSVGVFDSSEKRRGPSWCDRILYRTRKDKLEYDRRMREKQAAERAEEQMKARGVDKEVAEEAVLFDYDPETDADNDYREEEQQSEDSDAVETKSGFDDALQLDYYTSHQRVLSSDHKPLDAVFTLHYKAVDPDLKAKVHQEVARELDKAENEGRPVVTVVIDHHHDHDDSSPAGSESPSFEGVNFGHIKYNHPKSRNITIANTGRVPATVGFVDRPVGEGQQSGIAPPWLSIHFDRPSDGQEGKQKDTLQQYTLQPGDAVNVELLLNVSDITRVHDLNEGREQIEDVLVLRIHNGRDYFLPLRGTWLQSSFARSIDKLMRIPEGGIRKLQHQRPDRSSSHGDEGVKWSAPREIFRLTEALEELTERTMAEWGMREEGGEPPWKDRKWPFAAWITPKRDLEKLMYHVREALDTDEAFSFPVETTSLQRLEALSQTFLTFLGSLEDGIVPKALWSEIEQRLTEKPLPAPEDQRMQIQEILSTSPPHSTLFTLLPFTLSRIANQFAPVGAGSAAADALSQSSQKQSQVPQRLKDNAVDSRQQVDAAYAAVFATVIFRTPEAPKEKERKGSELRRKHIIESFLNANWEEGGSR